MLKNYVLLLISCVFLFYFSSNSQLLVEEFDYNAGSLDTVSNFSWIQYGGSARPIQVLDGNLSYPAYPSSNIGRMIRLRADPTQSLMDYYRSFQTQSTGTVYASFLLQVINTDQLPSNSDPLGAYWIGFYHTNVPYDIYYPLVCIRRGTISASTYQLGIQINEQEPTVEWYDTNLNINQTYLIIFSYTFVAGDSNDIAALWINPDLTPTPPAPTVYQVSSRPDVNSLSKIGIRQSRDGGVCSPNAYVDGIRVGTNWSDAPLPIQLGMLTASYVMHNSVLLEWETVSEINNYGFYVERFYHNINDYITIEESFQPGAGYSLEPRKYSWIDENVGDVTPKYRLKQIDNDGLVTYYGPIMLNPNSVRVLNEQPEEFKLYQNYPNPFNPSTTIRFDMPLSGYVKLNVYNILGEQVAEILNSEMDAGSYEVKFDASNLTNGVYYYILVTNNFVNIKKMILVK